MDFRDRPLKEKLIAIIALASGIGLLLSFALSATIQASRHRDAMVTQLSAIAEVVAANSASAIQFRDAKSAADTLRGLDQRTDIVGAWIVLPDGSLFAGHATDSGAPEIMRSSSTRRALRSRLRSSLRPRISAWYSSDLRSLGGTLLSFLPFGSVTMSSSPSPKSML